MEMEAYHHLFHSKYKRKQLMRQNQFLIAIHLGQKVLDATLVPRRESTVI